MIDFKKLQLFELQKSVLSYNILLNVLLLPFLTPKVKTANDKNIPNKKDI